MKLIRIILLFPLTLLVWVYSFIRNKFFVLGILKTNKFNIAVIGVGNLSTGGTGKTPVVEYLTGLLLKNEYSVAVLSRGYKRKSKGYIYATSETPANLIGDEPSQIKRKFEKAHVAVCEKRVNGIQNLLKCIPDLNAIILDDVFQHRSVKPGLNILLSDYSKPYYNDWILPSGNLREGRLNKKRADIIIVTKSPNNISDSECKEIQMKISPSADQLIYFSYIGYEKMKPFSPGNDFSDLNSKQYSVLLFAGISNPDPLAEYLGEKFRELVVLKFNDHHQFKMMDFNKIETYFRRISNSNKIVVTTEKDIARIENTETEIHFKTLPLFYVPIKIGFRNSENEQTNSFDNQILNYVRKNTRIL